MTAPHSDRDHSGDPFALPFWPPAHRHAVETQQAIDAEVAEQIRAATAPGFGRFMDGWLDEALKTPPSATRQRRYEDAIAGAYRGGMEDDRLAARAAIAVADAESAAWRSVSLLNARRAESAESVARGQQQVIEAQRATLDAVRAVHVPCSERPLCTDDDNFCHECGHDSPCLTARLLDAAPNETKAKP